MQEYFYVWWSPALNGYHNNYGPPRDEWKHHNNTNNVDLDTIHQSSPPLLPGDTMVGNWLFFQEIYLFWYLSHQPICWATLVV
jgi:hypothetical protein